MIWTAPDEFCRYGFPCHDEKPCWRCRLDEYEKDNEVEADILRDERGPEAHE